MKWQPIPSKKSPEIENLLGNLFGVNRKEKIESKQCVFCDQKVELDSFDSELSQREFHISGICQACQNETFQESE